MATFPAFVYCRGRLFTAGGRPPYPDAAFGRETCVFHGPSVHVSHGLTDRPHTSGPAFGREKLGVLLAFGRLAGTVSWTHGKVYRLCVEIPSDLSALSRQKSVYLDLARRKRRIPSAMDRCTQALAPPVSFPR